MTFDNVNQLKKILIANGYHITKARLVTFEVLLSSKPQSISEVLEKSGGRVDRVSVYRNIELFEKLGIVHRIYVGWKYKLELSDQFVAHHHHLSCLSCGKVIDIQDEKHIDEFISQVADQFGFEPRHHQFEIDGYCSQCLKALDAIDKKID